MSKLSKISDGIKKHLAKKDSSNLLASAAPIGVGLGVMAQGEDAEAAITNALGSNLTPNQQQYLDAMNWESVLKLRNQAQPEQNPIMDWAGRQLAKVDTPIGNPFEGISNYLIRYDESLRGDQRLSDAFGALADVNLLAVLGQLPADIYSHIKNRDSRSSINALSNYE
jgi:hypothetical protein